VVTLKGMCDEMKRKRREERNGIEKDINFGI
jgi:hypothetical protein